MAQDLSPSLSSELNIHLYLQARLKADFPDLDDETLTDTLEGLSNLPEALGAILRSRAEDEVLITGLKAHLQDLQARLQRLQERSEKKRMLVGDVMDRAQLQRLTLPDLTVSLRKTPPPVEILDEVEIPPAYWRLQPPKLDRVALSDALRSGVIVTGARLGEPRTSISIRVR